MTTDSKTSIHNRPVRINPELGSQLAADGVTPVLHGTVYEAFCRTAAHCHERSFIDVPISAAQTYGIAAGPVTYAQAASLIEKLRNEYVLAGYGHGHRVGLLLENRPAYFWHWLALNALGVSVVPINADFQITELSYLLVNSDVCAVVSLPSHHARLREAALAHGLSVQVFAPDAAIKPALRAAPRSDPPNLLTECGLLYTSGTTGQPKGCILPNEYYLFAGVWYRDQGGALAVSEDGERLLSPLPLVHMNAMAVSSMVMLLTGGTIILIDRFHPSSWWRTVRESRATIIHYLGVMPAMLLSAPASADDQKHQVRFGFGAGVDRRHHASFEQRFGFALVEGWAMTETGSGGCIMATHEPRKVGSNCFGRPPAGVAWRIVDDDGKDLPAAERTNVPGELLVRWAGEDPQFGFFKGYLKQPEATEAAWSGGWFHTGDIVSIDEDGYFHFIDRKKNVIRRSGENISAVEVEGVLLQHAAVASVGVAPVPDELRGDEVMACVIAAPGVQIDDAIARDITRHCLNNLAYFKAPGYIAVVPALPLTATQKIQRGGLRELAQACLQYLVKSPGGPTNQPTSDCLFCADLRDLKKRQPQANDG